MAFLVNGVDNGSLPQPFQYMQTPVNSVLIHTERAESLVTLFDKRSIVGD